MKLQRYKLHGECGSYYEFFKHHDGDWLKASDAEALQAENDRLEKRVQELEAKIEEIHSKGDWG